MSGPKPATSAGAALRLTPEERRLRTLLHILAALFTLAIFAYLLPALGVFGPTLRQFYNELPFVTNSVVKIGTLALLAFFAAADVRANRLLTVLVIAGHIISELAMVAVLIWGDTARVVSLGPPIGTRPVRDLIIGAMVLDGVILVLLVWFHAAAERARYGLRYFSPMEFRTLSALAEVVVAGNNELLTAEEVAYNTDRYLGSFRARSKWLAKAVMTGMQVYPLFSLKAPFSYLSAADRLQFLKKRFYRDVHRRLLPGFLRMLAQASIRMAKQLSYLGYYADPRTFASVGYVPFSQRPDRAERLERSPVPPRAPVYTRKPSDVDGDVVTGDIVIVGSGAAASVLAHEILRRHPDRAVLMLERGDHVDPSQFTEDEVEMLSRLYADGALQLSRDFRLQVLQGSCVGGTTVVNNAVCFRMPDAVLDRWNGNLSAGLDAKRLGDSFAAVERMIRVTSQNEAPLNPGADPFGLGVRTLGLDAAPNRFAVVDANIDGCLGCGYCNIGCAYGKKLSMLDTVLPAAQAQAGRERFSILAGCEALELTARGSRVTSVLCRLADGRRIEVKGRTVIIAAGAISSSLLLMRSGAGGRNVGQRVSFNLGSPLTAAFSRKLDAYAGLQISHYLSLAPNRGFIIETWYNPPVAQALAMPGWFEDHFRNMHRYDRLSAVGILVGSEAVGRVRNAGLTGREIDYEPTNSDLERVLDGLILSGEIFLAGGAESVMPATFDFYEFRTVDELRRLRELVRDAADLTLGTGHPMGGNAMSADRRIGVVDPQFRVYGYDNLYVCDASVFPSSVGVNPQLTVMALAHYAAPLIMGETVRPAAAVPAAAAIA
jgi:choline dehydrogenase-like flavoprotein